MMLVQHHEAAYFTQRCIDTFERLYQEGAERAKVMAIAIHPYISGQPHRIKYLEAVYDHIAKQSGVLHWNGVEMLDWYLRQKAARQVLADGALVRGRGWLSMSPIGCG